VLAEFYEIRLNVFRKFFKDYLQSQIEQLVKYAKPGSGISRYKKIEFFYDTGKPISLKLVNHWANQFSKLVRRDISGFKKPKKQNRLFEFFLNRIKAAQGQQPGPKGSGT
jgi:hypothetical protein